MLNDRHGENVAALDLRGISSVADYFIIATGNSVPHLNAMGEGLKADLRDKGVRNYRSAGSAASGWIVSDYVDVVVHLMTEASREYYGLEQIWSDARPVELPRSSAE